MKGRDERLLQPDYELDAKKNDDDSRSDKCATSAEERGPMGVGKMVRIDFAVLRTAVFRAKSVRDQCASDPRRFKRRVHRSVARVRNEFRPALGTGRDRKKTDFFRSHRTASEIGAPHFCG